MGCLQQLNKFTFGVKQKHPEIFSSLNFSIHKYYKDTYSNSFLCNGKMYPVWMGSATFQTSGAAQKEISPIRANSTAGRTKQVEVLVKTPQNHPV